MADREYLLDLDPGARLRCWHRTERGQVTAFSVQLELLVENRWQSVIRFDTAHGFPHRDVYRRSGAAIKTPLAMDLGSARTFAQRDTLANWR